MRLIVAFALCLALLGCKSQKSALTESSAITDSVAARAKHRTVARLDSAALAACFEFDTLTVEINRSDSAASERLFVKAVKGRLTHRCVRLQALDSVSDLRDSADFKRCSLASESELSAATSLYEPPSGTGIAIIALAAAGIAIVLLYLYLRF